MIHVKDWDVPQTPQFLSGQLLPPHPVSEKADSTSTSAAGWSAGNSPWGSTTPSFLTTDGSFRGSEVGLGAGGADCLSLT